MEWKLINIWDVVQTKTGVVGIVITKFTDHINLALHGHIQTILITDIEFKLGNIKSLINIFPISKQFLRFGSDGDFHCSSAGNPIEHWLFLRAPL